MSNRVLQPLRDVARDLHVDVDAVGDDAPPRLTDRGRHASTIRGHAADLVSAIDRGDVERTLSGLCNLIYDCYAAAILWRVDLTPYWDEVRRARVAGRNADVEGILKGAEERACPACGVVTQLRRGGKLATHRDPRLVHEQQCVASGLTLAQGERLARLRAAHEGPEEYKARECKGGCGRLVPKGFGGWCDGCAAERRDRGGQFSSREVASGNVRRGQQRRELIERLWGEGLTWGDIGRQLGWSESTIRRGAGALRALGYNLPHRDRQGMAESPDQEVSG